MSDIIQITYDELTTALECEVIKAVQKVGINVNKEELLEALTIYESLVRCKDCKWRDNFGCALEIVDKSDRPNDDDYCSFGERKDNEAD